jgi:DnaJ-class molecular chaperone
MPYEFEVERIIQQENMQQTREIEKMTIQIPQGVDTGEAIILQNRGHNIMSVCGDIRLNIHVSNKTEFARQGIDLHYKKTITLKEALCGFKFKIDHLNGNQISLNVNAIIYPGAKQVIKNFGMTKDGKTGDFVLEFNVAFPESLTQEQKDEIAKII